MKSSMDKDRPLSWSAISSFEYDPNQWYEKYVLKIDPPVSPAMEFGKLIGGQYERDELLAPILPREEVFEYELRTTFNKIPLIGYIDAYTPHTSLIELKTGKKAWDQKRADTHGQIDMYLLQLNLIHKVRPEDVLCRLLWLPTMYDERFRLKFVDESVVHIFETRRTMLDLLRFGKRINDTYQAMKEYAEHRKKFSTADARKLPVRAVD